MLEIVTLALSILALLLLVKNIRLMLRLKRIPSAIIDSSIKTLNTKPSSQREEIHSTSVLKNHHGMDANAFNDDISTLDNENNNEDDKEESKLIRNSHTTPTADISVIMKMSNSTDSNNNDKEEKLRLYKDSDNDDNLDDWDSEDNSTLTSLEISEQNAAQEITSKLINSSYKTIAMQNSSNNNSTDPKRQSEHSEDSGTGTDDWFNDGLGAASSGQHKKKENIAQNINRQNNLGVFFKNGRWYREQKGDKQAKSPKESNEPEKSRDRLDFNSPRKQKRRSIISLVEPLKPEEMKNIENELKLNEDQKKEIEYISNLHHAQYFAWALSDMEFKKNYPDKDEMRRIITTYLLSKVE